MAYQRTGIDPGLLGIAQDFHMVGFGQSKDTIVREEAKAVLEEMQRRAGLARSRGPGKNGGPAVPDHRRCMEEHVPATEDPLRVDGIDEIDGLVEVGEEISLRVRGVRLQTHEDTR